MNRAQKFESIIKGAVATFFAFALMLTACRAQVNLTNGIWAYYGFNDGTASNNTINGPVGTFAGNPTVTNGVFQGALYYNGINDSVVTASGFYISHITVCAYVMLASPLASGTEQDFLNQYPDPSREGFALGIVETNGVDRFVAKFHPRHEEWGTCAYFPEISVLSLTPVIPGKVYHVALTYDYAGKLMLYVNGVKEAEIPTNGSNYYNCSWGYPTLTVGSRNNTDMFFNGLVDEVYIYTRALSQSEIKQLQYPPIPPHIVQQPVGTNDLFGSNAVFTVSAASVSALPLFYQWQRNGSNLLAESNLVGVASNFLIISNVQMINLGFYSVIVTNVAGSVTSSAVLLGITNALDSDEDGIPDWWESTFGLNPSNPSDATNYPPGDQLTYLQKYLYGLDPLTSDTDNDGVSDYRELFTYGTDPRIADTSGDGIPDGWEIQFGLNPLANNSKRQAGFVGVSYLQIYQYNLTHTNQLEPWNTFPDPGRSIYEVITGGGHTNRVYYDREDRLVGEEFSSGTSIAYTYDGNGNPVRQTILSRASETNGLPVLWKFLNGFTNGTSAEQPYSDFDGDGWNNYQEFLAGTSPTNGSSSPNLLGNPGTNIASLALPFTVSNFVMGVGQLDGAGAEEIVVAADGNPGTNINYLLVLTQDINGWSTQRVSVGQFGVTSIAVGQPTNRPTAAIYVGLRTTNGNGRAMEFTRSGGTWQSNLVAISTNEPAFVAGIRQNGDLLVNLGTNSALGQLWSLTFSNAVVASNSAWNMSLVSTNSSHRGLPTHGPIALTNDSPLRLLDTNGIEVISTNIWVVNEPTNISPLVWRGLQLAFGTSRPGTNQTSLFYCSVSDSNHSGTIDAGDGFAFAEYQVSNNIATALTFTNFGLTTSVPSQSFAMAAADFLGTGTKDVFTAEPNGGIYLWSAPDSFSPMIRQIFSTDYQGQSWHGLAPVKMAAFGQGLVGVLVDPASQNACSIIFWPPQPLFTPPQSKSIVETAPLAVVLPSASVLGSTAVLNVRLWDNEGNFSTPFLQYQIPSSANWTNATLVVVDGFLYNTSTRVATSPGGVTHSVAWDAEADVGNNVRTNVLLRARARDFMLLGDWSSPTAFELDTTIITNPYPTNSPLNFTSVGIVPGGIAFNWEGGMNSMLILQRSPALAGTNAQWINVWTGMPPTPFIGGYTDFFGTNQMEFYRMKIGSP